MKIEDRSWVGPSLWWHAGTEPRIGETFKDRSGTTFEITSVVASDGGWLYETQCNALGITRIDDPVPGFKKGRRWS